MKISSMVTLFMVTSIFLSAEQGFPQESEVARYPSRPITFVMPYSAGGTADLTSRLLLKGAEKYLGQSIVMVNKAGAGGAIGVAAIATAKPDGYTIGYIPGGATLFIRPFLEALPYHPIRDIRYVMQFGDIYSGVIVKANSQFKSFRDLIDYARQNPNKLTYGTNAPNSMPNFVMEQVAKKEKVQFTHIPFKSSPEFQTGLLGGHIQFAVGDFNYSLIEGGELRLIALLAEKRVEFYPDTPILRELGYDIPAPAPSTIGGPKGMPDEIAARLQDSFTKALKEPAFLKGMQYHRAAIFYRNSKELSNFVAQTYELYAKILKESGLLK